MDKELEKKIERLEERIETKEKELEKMTTERRTANDEYKAYTGTDEDYRSILKKSIQTINDSIANINKLIESDIEETQRLRTRLSSSYTLQNGMLSREHDVNLLYLCFDVIQRLKCSLFEWFECTWLW